ncbi:hypothetical protein L218DRAFT_916550 [Marasmius fiardii PR-910]|nr:hypothetical protein L218DRAFT_916550 [Marasmius fiardii PR-910]
MIEKDIEHESRQSGKKALQKSQVIIKRPQYKPRTAHTRAHISEELDGPSASSSTFQTATFSQPESSTAPQTNPTSDFEPDEVQRIRTLLQPPPIPGVSDWGIPPEPGPNDCEPCDPAIEAKLLQFYHLKHPTAVPSATSASDPAPVPKHFNDSLMSNRSFRNPHLYAKLVEFVDVDERVSNFPKKLWDPYQIVDGPNGWDAEKIAAYQKLRSEQQAKAQSSGKRSQIDFTSSSHHSTMKDKNWERDKNKYNPYGAGSKGARHGGFGRGRVRLGK